MDARGRRASLDAGGLKERRRSKSPGRMLHNLLGSFHKKAPELAVEATEAPVMSLGAGARRASTTAASPMTVRRASSPAPPSGPPAHRDRRVSAPDAGLLVAPGRRERRRSSPDPLRELEQLQEMFEEDRAADIMAAADSWDATPQTICNGRVVPQLTTHCWEPTHAPRLRVTTTTSLPLEGSSPFGVPEVPSICVTDASPQVSPRVQRRSIDDGDSGFAHQLRGSTSFPDGAGEEADREWLPRDDGFEVGHGPAPEAARARWTLCDGGGLREGQDMMVGMICRMCYSLSAYNGKLVRWKVN